MAWWIAGGVTSLLLVGAVSLWLGKDTNWDLQNYHLYNGYSYWFDRLDIDHHPAGIQTFHNPVLDIATYPLLTAIPDWVGGFFLGALQGFSLFFILAIAREVLGNSRRDLFLSVLCAVTAITGATTWSEIGTTFGDLTTAISVLAAIYLFLRSLRDLRDSSSQIATVYCLAAGLVVGIASGLKFTNAIFTLALIASMVFIIPRHRLFVIVFTGITAGIGFLLVNGWWALELFDRFSNPLFPYFNAWFGSPYYPLINSKDTRFFPTSLVQAIFYPFYFSWNYQTAELPFKDFRFPVAFLCLISLLATKLNLLATKLTAATGNPARASATPKLRQERFLIAFLVIAYVLWLKLFSIQRYAIVIEMLIPLLCIIVIERILPYRLQFPTAITVLSGPNRYYRTNELGPCQLERAPVYNFLEPYGTAP